MKKMIFHLPFEINYNHFSGSQIRPQKMIQAFKNIGYEVDLIMGNCKTRKNQIEDIKEKIKNGIKYDFIYSESSTQPNIMTGKGFSKCLFLDYDFFKFCTKYEIKIGLFYRDIHWLFKQVRNYMPLYKRILIEFFYRYDLREYEKYIDILYLPSLEMFKHLPINFEKKVLALPPAAEEKVLDLMKKQKKLQFIYVGGLGELYDLKIFAKVLGYKKNCQFNLCTREKEWKINKKEYDFNNHLYVHHKSGNKLQELYEQSDIAVLYVAPSSYWEFAMAVKLFEYISFHKPIIAVKDTAVGRFVENNNIGWVIGYNENELSDLIDHIQANPLEIDMKIKNIIKIIPENTWESRAMKVMSDLK